MALSISVSAFIEPWDCKAVYTPGHGLEDVLCRHVGWPVADKDAGWEPPEFLGLKDDLVDRINSRLAEHGEDLWHGGRRSY